MSVRLILVRHGEPSGAYGVVDDPGLSQAGHAQARAVVQALLPHAGGAVWTSPLRRCRETAAPFCQSLDRIADVQPAVAEVQTPNGVADRRAWLLAAFPSIADPDAPPTRWADIGLSAWRAAVVDQLLQAQSTLVVFTHFIAMNAAVSAALGVDQTIVCRPGHCGIAALAIEQGALRLISAPEGGLTPVS
jgi:broad specificity phosphatase PhoE